MALSPAQESKRKAICAEFRRLMESRPDLSQAEVARMLNTTRSSIHKYINGLATPRPVVMEMFRSKLAKASRHEAGDLGHDDPDDVMGHSERSVIQALRRIEPQGRRLRMASAVRDMLLCAAYSDRTKGRSPTDDAYPLTEIERAALEEERLAAVGLANSARESSGAEREPQARPPAGGDTTGPGGRRVDSRTQHH